MTIRYNVDGHNCLYGCFNGYINGHKYLHDIYHGHETNSYLFQLALSLLMPIRCTINGHYPVEMVPDYKFSSFNGH